MNSSSRTFWILPLKMSFSQDDEILSQVSAALEEENEYEWYDEYFHHPQVWDSSSSESEPGTDDDYNDEDRDEGIARSVAEFHDSQFSSSSQSQPLDDSNEEYVEFQRIFCDACECSKQCMDKLSCRDVYEHTLNMKELTKSEKDMYLIGKIIVTDSSNVTMSRHSYQYYFRSVQICRNMFLFANDIGKFAYQSLLKHYHANGAIPRTHGNSNRKPHNSLTFSDTENVVKFITNYAEQNGLPMAAPLRGRDSLPPTFLPVSITKKSLHKLYTDACNVSGVKPVGRGSFIDIWRKCCPHVQIATPKSDVCSKCEILREKVSIARTQGDKETTTKNYMDHLQTAAQEHQVYRNLIVNAKTEFLEQSPRMNYGPYAPCSNNILHSHFTFDFSQSILIPHHAMQVGPLFFLTPRKIQIFGIYNSAQAVQHNFLIDENQTLGKDGTETHGPNAVISMLDFYLSNFGYGEKVLNLHCDNCPGQNKNKYMIWYLAWRVAVGLNFEINLFNQIVGHTKCLVDGMFGHAKKLYRRVDCDTLQDVADVFERSAIGNCTLLYPAWEWKTWKAFLVHAGFKPFKGIRRYHCFRFSALSPGVVFAREHSVAEEVTIEIFPGDLEPLDPELEPQSINPKGLSRQRREYLFKRIRPYVKDWAKDITCPK